MLKTGVLFFNPLFMKMAQSRLVGTRSGVDDGVDSHDISKFVDRFVGEIFDAVADRDTKLLAVCDSRLHYPG